MPMWENFTTWDPHSKESVEGTFDFFEACDKLAKERKWSKGMERGNALCRGSDGKEFPKDKGAQFSQVLRRLMSFDISRRSGKHSIRMISEMRIIRPWTLRKNNSGQSWVL